MPKGAEYGVHCQLVSEWTIFFKAIDRNNFSRSSPNLSSFSTSIAELSFRHWTCKHIHGQRLILGSLNSRRNWIRAMIPSSFPPISKWNFSKNEEEHKRTVRRGKKSVLVKLLRAPPCLYNFLLWPRLSRLFDSRHSQGRDYETESTSLTTEPGRS